MKRKVAYLVISFFLIVSILIAPARLLAAPYYEGKILTIVVGFAAGTGYDRMTRILAKHLPKYIPGKPPIVVQNMPGSVSMLAANHLYHVVKPDGLTIGALNRALVFAQLLKTEGVMFDFSKYSWIGSPSTETTALLLRSDLPYKTIYDLQKAKKEIYLAGSGPSTINTQFGILSQDFLGIKVKMVEYRSSTEIWLAIERKEADGVWDLYNSAKMYIDRGLARAVLRINPPASGIEKLPVAEDLTTDKMGKTIFALYGALGKAGRPYVAPPGTPPHVANILKEAFAKAVKDPELKVDAEKAGMSLEYTSAEECLKAMNYILNQPAGIIKALSKYIKY